MSIKNPEWSSLESVKERVLSRLRDAHLIHQVHFLPTDKRRLEVYVFLSRDEDLAVCQKSGFIQLMKNLFNEELKLKKETRGFEDIRFEFDSHENVVKNFRGNYFLRLR